MRGRAQTWWIIRRNRLLASAGFQRLAWVVPGLRGIARRRAAALFDLVAGFTYSQWLLAAVRLGVLPMLEAGPKRAAELAAACDLPLASAEQLLRALSAIGIAQPLADGRHALGMDGAALAANAGVQAMIAHHPMLYADLTDPVALLRRRGGGQLAQFWPYAEGADGDVGPYSRLMAASQPMVAEAILDHFAMGGFHCLMDVGGGEGAFLAAVAARHPGLRLRLFDLPAVAARAGQRLGAAASIHPGDFTRDSLPEGADLITLVRILHDHDDAVVRGLLARAHAALPPGGTLLVAEPMAGARGAARMGDAYFGLYLLAMGSGRPRPAQEIMALLEGAGFTRIRAHRVANPFAAQLLSARKSA